MNRFLLDTNAVGDLMNRRRGVDLRAAEARRCGDIVGTCEVVVAELYFGVENSDTRDTNMDRVNRTLTGLKCWPLTREASREFGRLATLLRRTGTEIGRLDILIAAIALTLPNCILVSRDSDMLSVPGLTIENWATPHEAEPPA